ncbi:HAD hydrolase family protein [Streptomyces sp. OfavH-34-F]|uniref:HAD hydrolase family protein n=1 Tax=Streptomyces sp. OfavH-34-F TaxID=2917760 RepID=UPI001EF310E6|nr:HAD hydrolase family protein [Streptomyces sp. OfavH-34-F]MCG7523607.1 HAD hydrolase family protein [Streptomyces sp. OfavH-34-F]
MTPPATPPHYAWIVTDLDGTLVDRDLRIVPRSAEALRRYQDRGGTVVIATGRNEVSAGRYHDELGLRTPLIVYNGARVVDPLSGTRLLDLDLGDSWQPLRDDLLHQLPDGVGAVAFAGEDAHILRPAPALAAYAGRDRIELREDAVHRAPTKVMLIADRPGLGPLARLAARHCPAARLLQSEDTYLEILPQGAGKEVAVRRLAERAGVPMERVAAIGDNPNDTAMVRAAGLGAAVGDGHQEVRAAADLVVGPCGLGAVADLVERVLEGGGP